MHCIWGIWCHLGRILTMNDIEGLPLSLFILCSWCSSRLWWPSRRICLLYPPSPCSSWLPSTPAASLPRPWHHSLPQVIRSSHPPPLHPLLQDSLLISQFLFIQYIFCFSRVFAPYISAFDTILLRLLLCLFDHICLSPEWPSCAGTSTPPTMAATPVPALPPPLSYPPVPAPPNGQSASETLYTNGVHSYQGISLTLTFLPSEYHYENVSKLTLSSMLFVY